MHRPALALVVASVALFALVPLPIVDATHVKRIVLPYGEEERWLPLIAGYAVLPPPVACDSGVAAGARIFEQDFEAPVELQTLRPTMYWHNTNHPQPNLWHQTTFAGIGTDHGRDGPGKLYFGIDATGVFGTDDDRPLGTIAFNVEIPADDAPYHVAFRTKWAGQWNAGGDHMWVEIQPADGPVYVLCTVNAIARPTTAPVQVQATGACSPYREGPCLTDADGPAGDVLDPVEAAAPHWEARSAMIPLAFHGQSVQVRFTFDAAHGFDNRFLGWMLDDVVVTDLVVPTPTLPVM